MDRIRQLRKDRGLSQAKLAVMADMDPATLNRLERGTGNPNLKTLERVADALEVGVADLLPKALRRSSLEPSLNDVLADERRLSRFAEAIIAAAERWGEAVSSTDMADAKRFGLIEAALDLSDLIEERAEREDWEALPNQERLEIVTTRGKLTEAAEQGISYLHEDLHKSEETKAQEGQVNQRRAQIRELTRRISA